MSTVFIVVGVVLGAAITLVVVLGAVQTARERRMTPEEREAERLELQKGFYLAELSEDARHQGKDFDLDRPCGQDDCSWPECYVDGVRGPQWMGGPGVCHRYDRRHL